MANHKSEAAEKPGQSAGIGLKPFDPQIQTAKVAAVTEFQRRVVALETADNNAMRALTSLLWAFGVQSLDDIPTHGVPDLAKRWADIHIRSKG
jgi:hypothetical protein